MDLGCVKTNAKVMVMISNMSNSYPIVSQRIKLKIEILSYGMTQESSDAFGVSLIRRSQST